MASGSGGVHSTSVGSTRTATSVLRAATPAASTSAAVGASTIGSAFARRTVTADGLAGERSGPTDVAATGQGEERDRGEHDDDADGDGDDCGGTHDRGVSS